MPELSFLELHVIYRWLCYFIFNHELCYKHSEQFKSTLNIDQNPLCHSNKLSNSQNDVELTPLQLIETILIRSWQWLLRRQNNCYGPRETTCASLIARILPDRPSPPAIVNQRRYASEYPSSAAHIRSQIPFFAWTDCRSRRTGKPISCTQTDRATCPKKHQWHSSKCIPSLILCGIVAGSR